MHRPQYPAAYSCWPYYRVPERNYRNKSVTASHAIICDTYNNHHKVEVHGLLLPPNWHPRSGISRFRQKVP